MQASLREFPSGCLHAKALGLAGRDGLSRYANPECLEIHKSNKNERDTKNVLSGRIENNEPEALAAFEAFFYIFRRPAQKLLQQESHRIVSDP